MVAVAVVGVLAALAAPTLVKYIRRSKTAEASLQLSRMSEQARAYYIETHGAQDTRTLIRHQFPDTTALTPAASCCQPSGSDRCTPNVADWDDPTWKALHFSMEEPHYYRYEFVSAGEGTAAQFTARAIGDLDCDGVLATFELYGRIAPGSGSPSVSGGLYEHNALE
ncbi:MAG: hypothetical protein D6689_00890 [Deltaproteobacteria bacterium]|nr:MAG: hypothetical protein D6689_00890 [Deltaproteobacteria bacterium]